jgi:hypothetical protein
VKRGAKYLPPPFRRGFHLFKHHPSGLLDKATKLAYEKAKAYASKAIFVLVSDNLSLMMALRNQSLDLGNATLLHKALILPGLQIFDSLL